MPAYAARDLLRVPSLLSLSRLPLGVAFALAVRGRRRRWPLVVLLLAGLSDVLDGWYARRFGQATQTGAVVDALADKVFVGFVVAALVGARALSPAQALMLGTRELGELAIGAQLAARGDARIDGARAPHRFGKVTTILQYAAATAAVLRSGATGVIAGVAAPVGVLATVAYWTREVEARTRALARVRPAPAALEELAGR